MLYMIIGIVLFASIGFGLYGLISRGELSRQIDALKHEVQDQETAYLAEIEGLNREMNRKVSVIQAEQNDQARRHRIEITSLNAQLSDQARRHRDKIDSLNADLAQAEKFRHIPNVIEKSNRLAAEIASKLAQAQQDADDIVLIAHKDAERIKVRIAAKLAEAERKSSQLLEEASRRASEITNIADTAAREIVRRAHDSVESDVATARDRLLDADRQARILISVANQQALDLTSQAELQAKAIATQARKEAKEKVQKVEETLTVASANAVEIRQHAEARAREIAGQAYDALKRYEFYDQAARAKQNTLEGYAEIYMVPASHIIDELADEFGTHKAAERLRLARERTRIMEKNGLAASCNYPAGWKRDYAISFVLSAFNGKVDSILARLKPANQGRMIQEIKDAYALVNLNGAVFKEAKIHQEYLEARLEELKWAVALQRFKEKQRDEQRAALSGS